jgi:hypothetical protein
MSAEGGLADRAADQLSELLPMLTELAAQAGIASKKTTRR